MTTCTIVIPCYNESARLDVEAFRRFVTPVHRVRFLLVDDGSTDDTATVLDGLRASDPARFAVHSLSRNRGKAEAVRQGILRALEGDADAVGFWDADLATPLEAIPEFCDRLAANPALRMVFGARVKLLGRHVERSAVRHYLGRVFATAASTVLGLPIYDTQCGAKLFRAGDETRALFTQPFRTNWIFDVEILARFRRLCRSAELGPLELGPPELGPPEQAIYELPLSRWRDVAGSKVKPHDFFKAFFELGTIYWTYLRRGAKGDVCLPSRPRREAESPERPRRAA